MSDSNAWTESNKLGRWFVSANFFQSSLVCESKSNLTRVEHSKGWLLNFAQILDSWKNLPRVIALAYLVYWPALYRNLPIYQYLWPQSWCFYPFLLSFYQLTFTNYTVKCNCNFSLIFMVTWPQNFNFYSSFLPKVVKRSSLFCSTGKKSFIEVASFWHPKRNIETNGRKRKKIGTLFTIQRK